MPTSGERKALWFFALVALSGSAVRLVRGEPEVSSPGLEHQIRRVDSARAVRSGGSRARARPAGDSVPRGPVDLDRASAAEIEALPGIGPALAARIVAHRDTAGAFGWMDALCEVRGVGPALSERLRPLVTFSGPRRPVSAACGGGSKAAKKTRAARHRK
jgi:competence protein ComEA